MEVYYAPWQYELRELVGSPEETAIVARRIGIPDPVTATVYAGALFLAYAPLLQPGPPAKTPDLFPIYNVGGFVV